MRHVSVLLALLVCLAACAPPADPLPMPHEATPHPFAPAPELLGSEWVLVELNGAPPLPGSQITLTFEDEGVKGYAGCNWYGGGYQPIAPGEVAFGSTKRLCHDPAGVMEQESAFLNTLQAAAARRATPGRLEYLDAAGAVVAAFAEQAQLDLDPAALVDTRWTLVSLDGAAPLEGAAPTLAFESDTALSGFAGCRDYRGAYVAEGDDLTVPALEMLTTDCPDEARLLQEGEFTTLLSEATHWRFSERQLVIEAAGGRTLVFEAAE